MVAEAHLVVEQGRKRVNYELGITNYEFEGSYLMRKYRNTEIPKFEISNF